MNAKEQASEEAKMGEKNADEIARRVIRELGEFEFDITAYSDEEIEKIVTLITVYQSAREKIFRDKL